jgi:hypothetical protein
MQTVAPGDTLVGRERECAELGQAAAAAGEGHGSLVLLAGEAGVGKTSLVRQALAASGLLLLEGAAYQGVTLPYGPLAMALRTYRPATPGELLAGGPAARHLALVLPELGARPPDGDRATLFEALPPPSPRSPGGDRRRSSWTTCTGPITRRWNSCPPWRARWSGSRG